MEVRRLTAQSVEALGEGFFRAVVATFGVPYSIGPARQEMLERGCFGNPPPQRLSIFYEHSWQAGPIGVTERIAEVGNELHAEGRLFLDSDIGRRVFRSIKEGVSEFSIAFLPEVVSEN